ncbi:MAG: methionine--tRNA ligase subunit beta [Candidatus Anstonellales archaeon]
MINLDDFKKVELVVAKILEVENIPERDKLYRIKLSLGNEQRYIVSGIKQYYKPEELIGKKIIIIKNLEPKTIAGYQSNGMLLAAYDGKELSLITVDRDIPEGTPIS